MRANLRPRPFICKKQAFRLQRCRASRDVLCKWEDPAGCSALCWTQWLKRTEPQECRMRSSWAGLPCAGAVRAQGRGWACGCRCRLCGALRARCPGISLRKSSKDWYERVREVARGKGQRQNLHKFLPFATRAQISTSGGMPFLHRLGETTSLPRPPPPRKKSKG